ncbi:unnamed protein product [Mesocestoides corti]|uniref:Nuclear receptor domain-containing protein n=1 Tax=Mesocestoides corti TaxID=53468 RepID=A0A3P6H9X0_MESCO|nr:unnamed protein product [Mesocestoides corti]
MPIIVDCAIGYEAFHDDNVGPQYCITRYMDPIKRPQPRVVCGDNAMGFHYHTMSCDGCKRFFCHSMQGKVGSTCQFYGQCYVVENKNRTRGKKCRLDRCLEIGVTKERQNGVNRCANLNSLDQMQLLQTAITDILTLPAAHTLSLILRRKCGGKVMGNEDWLTVPAVENTVYPEIGTSSDICSFFTHSLAFKLHKLQVDDVEVAMLAAFLLINPCKSSSQTMPERNFNEA